MKKISDVFYSNEKIIEKSLDIYLPEGAPRAAFLYIHGGGIESGDKSFDLEGEHLADSGILAFSINYRMYPNAKFPQFIEDAAEAVAFAKKYTRDKGCDKLYVGGSSAGGYISMMLCFCSSYLLSVGLSNADIAGYFHDAGQPTAHFTVLKEDRGVDSRRCIIDNTAPLYYIGLEKSYPVMRFVVSDNDIKCRYEQTMLTLATLRHFGYTGFDHVVMHGSHCAYVYRKGEDGKSDLGKMIVDFIDNAGTVKEKEDV